MHADYYVVTTTVATADTAEKIGKMLVSERLAGCVNIIPGVRSIYSWQGELHDEPEWMLKIKTGHVKLQELIERLKEVHPYELPEVIAVPIAEGSEDYLRWIWDWVSAEL